MDIEIKKDKNMAAFDTGGGMRQVNAVITIDSKLSKRMKRKVVLYETLGCCLDYVLTHGRLEELSETLLDVFDQIEPC